MAQKHFICTHTFCSEQTRRLFLTPPENLNPPSQRLNEKEWSKASKGSYATCLQTWVGNDDFFFCHWIADDEEQIYKQIEAWELDDIINTLIHPMHRFMSAYRNSDEIQQFPESGNKW